jgi:YVTN family beta-propeller protein
MFAIEGCAHDLHLNIGGNSVSAIVAGAGGAWTQTVIPVGKGPEGIDLSPDGREVWSAHSRDGGVSIIDVATKKVVQTIDLGTKRSNRIKLTPDAKFALVSDLEAGEPIVLDARRGRCSSAFPRRSGRDPDPPAGGVAYVGNGDNFTRSSISNLLGYEKITTGTGPDGMAWRMHDRDFPMTTPVIQVVGCRKTRLDRRCDDGHSTFHGEISADRPEQRQQDDDDGVRPGPAIAGPWDDLG